MVLSSVLGLLAVLIVGQVDGGGGGVDLGNLWGLGVIAVALVVGQVITFRYVVQPERTRGDRLEAELIRVNTSMADKFVPALEAARRSVDRRESRRDDR